ncbi:MAG: primosomal protein N', partial [bacterium]
MEQKCLFADVLLPLPVSGTFTYRIPGDLVDQVSRGVRVVVQFGSRKIYTALVCRVHGEPPLRYEAKIILSVLDDHPVVNSGQITFWEWMASYYLCSAGEVMNAALPSAFKLTSETRIIISPSLSGDLPAMNEREIMLFESLHYRKAIPISEVAKIIGQQKIIPVIKTMIEKGIIVVEEELKDRYKPRKEIFVGLAAPYLEEEGKLRELFDQLEKRAKKQLEMLMTWVHLSGYGSEKTREVSRNKLLKKSNGSVAMVEGLVKKGVFVTVERIVSRIGETGEGISSDTIELTPLQQTTLEKIRESFLGKEVVLLHGVTSSGKTELYIKLIREAIDEGKQVLYLLPEIALTTQIINRLRKYFGDRVGVYHSRFNEQERVEIWNKVMESPLGSNDGKKYDIILGARSAVFLPFSRLGLVIVDEEHDSSFKQNDPAPRYQGRDAALWLAHAQGAKTLLGSATPAIESYFNARAGKYALVEIMERYGEMELPKIKVVDVKLETRRGTMRSHFSSVLLDQLERALGSGEQSILFQNRRGFSLRLECETCNWMPSCKNCDVTLVYHKQTNQLRCHYCGFVTRVPEKCPECQGVHIKMKGFGTEKIEEELGIIFPKARIKRMDLDTTRSKHSYQQIISDFEQQKIDILVGTQMVTKGLDFDHVSTVCILNADNMLSFPDFRAAERGFQLMAQVSGRSGRKKKQGTVL